MTGKEDTYRDIRMPYQTDSAELPIDRGTGSPAFPCMSPRELFRSGEITSLHRLWTVLQTKNSLTQKAGRKSEPPRKPEESCKVRSLFSDTERHSGIQL
jgi:hypothetical protein